MVDVKKRDELEAWLKTQPREVISVFAARAALRAFPAIGQFHPNLYRFTRPLPVVILPLLWGMSTALYTGIWRKKSVDIGASANSADDAYSYISCLLYTSPSPRDRG